jgi:acetolactate synthase-1/2/3 large subunit
MPTSAAHSILGAENVGDTVADVILQVIRSIGVRHVFGVPGGAIEPFLDAVSRFQERREMELVVPRHEVGAAFMVDGFFRETGLMGVCFGTSGPGATNLVTGAASALLEQVPMLIITGQPALHKLGRRALQDSSCAEIDVVAMFKTVTKYSSMVSHPEQLIPKLTAALAQSNQHPRGPVHLSIPADVLRAPLQLDALPSTELLSGRTQSLLVSSDAVARISDALSRASRPLLFIGEHSEAAMEPLLALLHTAPMPVVTSSAGKRWFPTTHDNYVGVFGFAGHESAVRAVQDADLILAVGSSMREFSTNNWSPALLGTKLIQLSPATADLAAAPMAGCHFVGDLLLTLDAVARRAPQVPRFWVRDAYSSPAPAHYQARDRLLPPDVVRYLAQSFPTDTKLYVDGGNSLSWAIHYAPVDRRLSRIHTGLGFGSMGWAIGAAVGAAFAAQGSGSRIACLTGDGAWLMSGLELTVAVEHQLPVIFVVLNDSALGMVRHGQRLGRAAQIGNALPIVDFAAMANAAGAKSLRIRTLEELEALCSSGILDELGPVVLEMLIDPEFPPPMATRVSALANAVS